VSRVSASITVPGRAVQAERVWYDPSRWASWIEGFGHVVSLDDSWPRKGARRLWDSLPQGRGRVSERVVAYEMRTGQTLAVEDGRMEATQRVSFEPQPDSVKITLSLEYRLKDRNVLTPIAATSRPASVRAAASDTCWPSTARSASSPPSTVPGTRRPGAAATSGPIRESPPSTAATAAGSASRSSSMRQRATTSGRSSGSARRAVSRTWSAPGSSSTTAGPRDARRLRR
jgi:hypothetical protein